MMRKAFAGALVSLTWSLSLVSGYMLAGDNDQAGFAMLASFVATWFAAAIWRAEA